MIPESFELTSPNYEQERLPVFRKFYRRKKMQWSVKKTPFNLSIIMNLKSQQRDVIS